MTNEHRIDRATLAIEAYPSDEPDNEEATLIDLLTDLRHYAEDNRVDFDLAVRLSQDHFKAEMAGE